MAAAKREAVAHIQTTLGMSEWEAYAVVGANRTSMRYRSRRDDDRDLRSRLCELAQRCRFGYRWLYILPQRDAIAVKSTNTQRLYGEQGLSVSSEGTAARLGRGGSGYLAVLHNQP